MNSAGANNRKTLEIAAGIVLIIGVVVGLVFLARSDSETKASNTTSSTSTISPAQLDDDGDFGEQPVQSSIDPDQIKPSEVVPPEVIAVLRSAKKDWSPNVSSAYIENGSTLHITAKVNSSAAKEICDATSASIYTVPANDGVTIKVVAVDEDSDQEIVLALREGKSGSCK